jgi:hypothetical protein
MKLIFCLLLIASQVSFGQIILKDSLLNKTQLPSYKNNLLQMQDKFFKLSPNAESSVKGLLLSPASQHDNFFATQPSSITYLMSPDNMPCVVPDLAKSEKIPNAKLHYLQSDDLMPNGIPVEKKSKKPLGEQSK